MEIKINDGKSLGELKTEFSGRYPFLKIEFFKNAHTEGGSSPKSEMITEELSIGEIRSKHNAGDLVLKEEMKVSEVERQFEDIFGIHAQVFRKSGDIWLETSATDNWTLKEQNSTGEEMS